MSLTTVDSGLISSGAITLTTQVTGTLPVANGGTGVTTAIDYGYKNRIINGGMAIWQRGTTLSTNNSQGYYIDRMWGFSGSSTAATFTQISSTGLDGFPYATRAQRTAGNTGTGGLYCGQIIESNNLQDLQGQSVTISFWARAGANYSATSNILTIYLRTGTTADQGLNTLISGWAGAVDQTSAITLTTSWQKFSATFTVASNAQEITPFLFASATGTAGANDYFDVTGVQLEKGSTATSFDYRPYGTELALCQRYYVKTYNQSVVPGAVSSQGALFNYRSGTEVGFTFQFPVNMRTQPSTTLYSPNTGTAAKVQVGSTDFTAAVNGGFVGEKNTMAYAGSLSGTTDCYIHMTASAEL